ncbi:GNAT family N-acetyltransferase [Donghicola sp. C2-DW-16]|uniref:GNAT family N-acetyltransferase n=1 Tax=Donghicola mangrovi TaxID=2729614 RepID=A0ABX2PFA3_9RHOB|nr:GNAT family N-acetyltransferase [Donghicola mangrovi]NVO27749.1 GNAT family N-acetyltransferase [Donghicola mangrovi]
MGGFSVRAGTGADADRIAGVHVACWRETYRGMVPDFLIDQMTVMGRAEMWRGVFSAFEEGAFGATAVLEQDGLAVGFAGFCAQRDAALRDAGYGGEITAMYVRKACQGQGAGRLLMGWCADGLLAAGIGAGALWALRENAPARAFYEHLGGELCGEKQEDRDGAVLHSVAYGWPDLRVLAGA